VICPACSSPNEAGRKFCGECGARLAAVCASCGSSNSPTARFCGECGNLLASAPSAAPAGATATGPAVPRPAVSPASVGPVAERRLVSVLFADLVGFTSLSEGRDPEAVRELLSEYFAIATDVLGRYGGTVEKFIGDAVMAIWGAPMAHEDDAERAVRAALELVDAVQVLGPGIQARAAVLTGEAAVTIGARDQGIVAGDLPNTAARLQSVAPAGAVLVGEQTRNATASGIAYEEAGEQLLKGKAAPVPAWRAVRVVSDRGGRTGRDDRLEAPFVGRDAELRLLKDLFHATSRERRVRLVSITGQAGIGKSRLAWEFLKYVDGVVESVWWHEGRSPSYGEGVTFWALGEMIRSRARLLETDDAATTRARIADLVDEHIPDEAERRRVEVALLALLGAGEAPPGGAAELFSAWRTFFERLAGQGTVALLFEDLHWSDPGTLDFIEHIMEWSRDVPILIITLARPELLETRPGWGAGKRAFLALDLQPLDEPSMRELLAGLVPGLPDPAVQSIVARAEGIPLYAVETIRMLVAEGRLVERSSGGYEPAGPLGELAIPSTLHALIAARLDSLEGQDRAVLQDAAVLGTSFTADALSAIEGGDREGLGATLARLVRNELLRVERDPRSPERGQYAFVQALIREVAYSTLSLRDRRARHLAAARYFESIGDEELAGALAAHYVAAYKSSAEGPEAEALGGQARISLRAAAARAQQLGAPAQAVTFLRQAVEVTTFDGEKAELLEQAAENAGNAGQLEVADALLAHAIALREQGADDAATANAMRLRVELLSTARQRDEAIRLIEQVLARFGDLGDDPRWVRVLVAAARVHQLQGNYDRAQELSRVALARAERTGQIDAAARCLLVNGMAAFFQGRLWEGRALSVAAGELAEQAGLPDLAMRSAMTVASIAALDDPRDAVARQKEALEFSRRLGQRGMEITVLGNLAEDARRTGEWDWVEAQLRRAQGLDLEEADSVVVDAALGALAGLRGTLDEEALAGLARRLGALEDRDVGSSIYDLTALNAFSHGRWAEAAAAWIPSVDLSDYNAPYVLPRIAVAAVLAGDAAAAGAALDRLDSIGTRGRATDADRATVGASIAALEGDRAGAIAGYRVGLAAYRALGLTWDEALLGLQAAVTLGPTDPEVAGWLASGREILLGLGALTLVEEADRIANGEQPPAASHVPSGEGVAPA
jgi:class 3 adenylate cyclase/tetratricopeptide (TPR) repeat protein